MFVCSYAHKYAFRNYLENVAESIADWLKEKEAEYQAHFLSMEVEKIRQADEVEHIVGMKKRNRSSRKSGTNPFATGRVLYQLFCVILILWRISDCHKVDVYLATLISWSYFPT